MSTSTRKIKLLQIPFWFEWWVYIQAALSFDWKNVFSTCMEEKATVITLQRRIRMALHYQQCTPSYRAQAHHTVC